MPWGSTWQDASHGSRSNCQGPRGHEHKAMKNYMPEHCRHPQMCVCKCLHCIQAPFHVQLHPRDGVSMPEGPSTDPSRGLAALACGREGMLLGDSHMMLFLSFKRVAGSSLGVCGVPRAVEALVESLSKASMSGDWGELSIRLATSALWYCCRVTWAHRRAPSSVGTEPHQDLSETPNSRSKCRTSQHPPGTHQAPGAQWGKRAPGQEWPAWDSPCQPRPYLDELHVAEDVHGVVGRVDVVAAAVELRAAASIVLPVGGLGAVEATAA